VIYSSSAAAATAHIAGTLGFKSSRRLTISRRCTGTQSATYRNGSALTSIAALFAGFSFTTCATGTTLRNDQGLRGQFRRFRMRRRRRHSVSLQERSPTPQVRFWLIYKPGASLRREPQLQRTRSLLSTPLCASGNRAEFLEPEAADSGVRLRQCGYTYKVLDEILPCLLAQVGRLRQRSPTKLRSSRVSLYFPAADIVSTRSRRGHTAGFTARKSS